jgi:signal transduction histidine kinase/CheY-like chemotaxis protein
MNGRPDPVHSESIRVVYRQLPLTLGVSLVNALITAVVLSPQVESARLAGWLVAFTLMVGGRFVLWLRFIRLPAGAVPGTEWERLATGGALVSGGLWGVCSLLLMPAGGPYPLFVAFVIGGMCAGAATVNAAHFPSVVAFILPAALPLAAWFLMQGTRISAAMAVMTILFAGALIFAARRFSVQFAEGVRGRLALAERTAELAEANAKLHAEIAEREQAEAALRQAQKLEALGGLTAGIAHDFNNLLMVIQGAAEALRRRLAGSPGPLRQVGAILRATERGASLTRQLLAFARKDSLDPEVVDPNAVLRGTASLLEATLGKSIRVDLALQEELPQVFVDRGEIERAIINLAINARDAMPEGGVLTLRTRLAELGPQEAEDLPPGRYVAIEVADTGTGMTEEVRARAFDPFFTTKPPGVGSGLGLSQVYGLLRQSGGTARIASVPGVGTTVTLFLPPAGTVQRGRGPAEQPVLSSAPERAQASEPLHIVLLDDEDLVREVVTDLLEGAGYRVSAFAVARDALRCVETDASVALLVTDLGLPDRRGDEVARQARQTRPELPVLFITGYNEHEVLGGEPWQLRKPFGEADLLAAVAAALGRRPAAA